MSLFTIILRAAINYNGDLDEAIISEPYGETTKKAIDYFISGNCYYVGHENGWGQQFDAEFLNYYKISLDSFLSPTSLTKEIKLTFCS